jgi:hypothetical protein
MPSLTNIIRLAPETIVKYLPLVSAWVSAYLNPMSFQIHFMVAPGFQGLSSRLNAR